MKALKKLAIAAAAFGFAASVHATVVTNTYDPANVAVTNTTPYTYTQNLTPQINALLSPGATYTINSASLNVFLTDPQGGNEVINFILGSGTNLQTYTGSGNNQVPNGNNLTNYLVQLTTSLPDLQLDNILNVKLAVSPTNGNYIFDKSILSADISVVSNATLGNGNNVPEPATLGLLGLGLLGLVSVRRKKI